MAVYEYKQLSISPSSLNSDITIRQCFGWEYVSSQEINNTESHLETRNDTLYSVTTKENYTNVMFRRDTTRKNIQQLRSLEKQYDLEEARFFKEIKKVGRRKRFFSIKKGIVFSVFGIIAFAAVKDSPFIGLSFIGLGILFIVMNKMAESTYKKKEKISNKQQVEILHKARSLL